MSVVTDLFDAIRGGDLPRVKEIIAEEPSLADERGDDGHTAVELAHEIGRPDIAAALRNAADFDR